MADDIRVATVGAGYFARFHHDAWSRMPGVTRVAVCDQDPARAEAFRAEFGAGAAYTDPLTGDEIASGWRADVHPPAGGSYREQYAINGLG